MRPRNCTVVFGTAANCLEKRIAGGNDPKREEQLDWWIEPPFSVVHERGGASSADLAGVPVLAKAAHLLTVEVGKQHAGELLILAT